MKTYYEKIKFVKDKTVSYLKKIFRSYGNELTLKLEDCDLLQNKTTASNLQRRPASLWKSLLFPSWKIIPGRLIT